MSCWFSFCEPAPWTISSPPSGSRSGSQRVKARPSWRPISAGPAGVGRRRRGMILRRMMTTRSVYPQDSDVRDGRLSIGGCDVADLAREFGTPAYVYAEADLRAKAREFKD